MTHERWEQVEKVFRQALEQAADQRSAFVKQATAGDEALSAEVESLLKHHDQAQAGFMAANGRVPLVAGTETDIQVTLDSARRAKSNSALSFEGYQILSEIHRGGQGIVYQAIQESTKRKVALKVLLEGSHASHAARRRFEREIELVAQLKHPNIISIFHSGQDHEGRQYYVMDYVRGQPLNAYVRDRRLTLEETLKLFSIVCDAIQYAHQRGIIHRDLKPSNILVDGEGSPRILDFGLAKWLAAPAQNVVSISQQIVGTLPYMSPEQARGNPDEIDTRTDIYALGVILYELLTGNYPYPVVGQIVDVLRHIIETPPTPPSKQWSSDSGVTRRSKGRARVGMCPIDDDVQVIVMKALSKDRERRYSSAADLARDVGHYLKGEPIAAKRDSAFYVLRKLAGQHKYSSAAILALLVTIVSTASISLFYYRRSEAAWQARDADAERAQATSDHYAGVAEAARQSLANAWFGWFLAEWGADHIDSATRIRDQTPKSSPEYSAMQFLLDPQLPDQPFLQGLPSGYDAFGQFVVGERHAKAGRTSEALAAYQRAKQLDGPTLYDALVTARIGSLQRRSADVRSGGPPK